MCLALLDTEIRIAKEDIICYKVMEKRGETLISLYQNMRYECGKMYVSETPMTVKYGLVPGAYIEEGFHSVSNEKEAERLKSALQTYIWLYNNLDTHKYVVVKCLIPSGTRYAAGFFSDFGKSFDSFCSERIIAMEEV
jgi:hypothetical protein